MDIKLFDLAVAVVTNECRERNANVSLPDMVRIRNTCEKIEQIGEGDMIKAEQVYIKDGRIYIVARMYSPAVVTGVLMSDLVRTCEKVEITADNDEDTPIVLFDICEVHFG